MNYSRKSNRDIVKNQINNLFKKPEIDPDVSFKIYKYNILRFLKKNMNEFVTADCILKSLKNNDSLKNTKVRLKELQRKLYFFEKQGFVVSTKKPVLYKITEQGIEHLYKM